MKRILMAVAAILLLCAGQASAQARWGVTAGMNFNSSRFTDVAVETRTGWNAGVTCLVDLPLGFSIQPSVLYNQKNANITENIAQDMGYIEVPVSVQWGPDLLLFRPFLDVTPYVGYAVSNDMHLKNLPSVGGLSLDSLFDNGWKGKERLEYGLGIGGGINVWKLQVIARYNWNFGSLYNVDGWDDIKAHFPDLKRDNEHFGGLTLSLAFLF